MTTDNKPVQEETAQPTTDAADSNSASTTPEPPAADTTAAASESTPQAAPTQPTPSVAEMEDSAGSETAPVPAAVAVVPPEAPPGNADNDGDALPPSTVAADAESPADASTSDSDERPADRLRGRLGNQTTDKPVGSVDIATQRPDTPTANAPIEIPQTDDLDANIEAEISSALGAETVPAGPAGEPAKSDAGGVEEDEYVFGPGSKLTGTVHHIKGDDVFVNAGLPTDVLVGLKQFAEGKHPAVGDTLKLVVDTIDGDGLIRARIPEARTKTRGGNWDGLAAGQVVDCQVTGTNKGGLQVSLANLKGFLPASQVDVGFVANMEEYVGQKLTVQITEVNPKKRNLVVSRKVLLMAEREEQQAGFWETLEVGKDYAGTVKTLKPYGAFVSLGPIDGFLHIGEISWARIAHPNEVLKEGQQIQTRVIRIDKEKNRISLGMKQLVQNPWDDLGAKYPAERTVNGKVTRISEFGAFVELEPAVEGLVHISELAWRRVGSVAEVLKVGDEKDFKVLEVDAKRKRVSLSLKALEQKPESMMKAEAEQAAQDARPPRKPNPNLQGGMGGGKPGGGLFGNPKDFN